MSSKQKTIAYIGLGKMGLNMVARLLKKKYRVFAYDPNKSSLNKTKKLGAIPSHSLETLIQSLKAPRLVWLMIPHQAVDSVIKKLKPYLRRGDTLIDGGNSSFWKSKKRAGHLKKIGVNFLDVGVSGGPWGAKNGACLMVGGEKRVYRKHERLLKDLAVKDGLGYFGKSGAGHFVKMIHNGIEYGMMQALAEGFAVMKKSEFKLELEKVAKIYNHGSVIESRLVAWLEKAFRESGENLKKISSSVAQSGEGLWTVKTAKKLKAPAPIIEASMKFRLQSQKRPSYAGKILSALRHQFGGHSVKR